MKNRTISTKQTINYCFSLKKSEDTRHFKVILPFKNFRNLSTFDVVKIDLQGVICVFTRSGPGTKFNSKAIAYWYGKNNPFL